ncbi:MAG: cell wall hydrolase [Sphingomonadaceae bacterium]|nr:cell wall hydrolase [Sphingomonadaceae bacterium]
MLIGVSVAIAVLVTQVDWQTTFDRLFVADSETTAASNRTKEQVALIEATQGDQTKVAAKGEEAQALNDAIPFAKGPVETALPFYITDTSMTNSEKALRCMTQAIYYEAGFEPVAGRYAVAQVILNRMRHPAFPKSVCGVIYQGSSRPGCQFSFACDGSLLRAPSAKAWAEARRIAEDVLSGTVTSAVGMATHYHANYVSPYWAPKLHKITVMGAHIFYRWPGNWGRRVAFNGVYRGGEYIPAVSSLANINAGTDGEGTEDLLVADTAAPVREVTDRRADNDIGGRIDTSKTWRLTIPMGSETRAKADAPAMVQLPALEATQ